MARSAEFRWEQIYSCLLSGAGFPGRSGRKRAQARTDPACPRKAYHLALQEALALPLRAVLSPVGCSSKMASRGRRLPRWGSRGGKRPRQLQTVVSLGSRQLGSAASRASFLFIRSVRAAARCEGTSGLLPSFRCRTAAPPNPAPPRGGGGPAAGRPGGPRASAPRTARPLRAPSRGRPRVGAPGAAGRASDAAAGHPRRWDPAPRAPRGTTRPRAQGGGAGQAPRRRGPRGHRSRPGRAAEWHRARGPPRGGTGRGGGSPWGDDRRRRIPHSGLCTMRTGVPRFLEVILLPLTSAAREE